MRNNKKENETMRIGYFSFIPGLAAILLNENR